MRQYPIIRTNNADLNKAQDNINNTFAPLLKLPLLDGRLIQNVPLVIGNNRIEHKLGRQPLGWLIVDQTTASIIYRASWDKVSLTLNSSAVCTISLWVF